jgi:hypothetical protein
MLMAGFLMGWGECLDCLSWKVILYLASTFDGAISSFAERKNLSGRRSFQGGSGLMA